MPRRVSESAAPQSATAVASAAESDAHAQGLADAGPPIMGDVSQERPNFGASPGRAYKTFTFPDDIATEIMGNPYWGNRAEADLTFGLMISSLRDELDATKAENPGLALLKGSIRHIGGQGLKQPLDYTYVEDWMQSIGPKGRNLAMEMWQEINQVVDPKVGKGMLAAASPWTL